MKKLLKIFAVLVVLVIAALLAAPLFISADMLKTRVADELSKATGRTITIEGNASLKLFPDIAVSLEKVSLGNPAGQFANSRMFYADKLETGVRLMPLLHKEVIITGVTLDGAKIHLEQNAAGVKNWEMASKPGSDTKQQKAEEKSGGSKFAIGNINVNDSVITYRAPGAAPVELKNIDLTLSGADGSEPLALDGTAEYRDDKITLSLDVKDSRGFMAGKTSPLAAEIDLPGGNITFDGNATKGQEVAAKGDVKLNISSLPSLLTWATGKAPAGKLPEKVSLAGPVEINGKRVGFNNLTAQADELTASGKLSIDASQSVPFVSGNLHIGRVDTARFSSSPSAQGSAPAGGATEGWSDKPMDLSALQAVNAKLALAIDSIKSGKLEIGATALAIGLQDGSLKLGIDKLALYGGNAQGNVSVSNAGIATALDIEGVQIEPLLVALNGDSRLSGTAAITLNVRGSGNSQKAIVSTLGGNMKLMVRNGAVKGVNIGKFLRDVKKGFLVDNPAEKTDFSELSASFAIANGIASNDDLALKAPILRVGGKGTINLPGRSINYRLLPTLVTSVTGQGGDEKGGLTVPLLITGSWSKPSITPDLAGMVEEGLKDPAALKNNLKGLKENLKDFNSPKDIGKALFGGEPKKATAPASTTEAPAAKPPGAKEQAIDSLFKALGK
jgi:AsmA protein